jgi:ATP-dependent Clp protease ATP-binding subunit ClpC
MTPSEEFLENLPRASDSYNDDSGQDDSLKGYLIILPINQIKIKTPVLDNFGDLTEMAEEGKLDPVVGREKKLNVFVKF